MQDSAVPINADASGLEAVEQRERAAAHSGAADEEMGCCVKL